MPNKVDLVYDLEIRSLIARVTRYFSLTYKRKHTLI